MVKRRKSLASQTIDDLDRLVDVVAKAYKVYSFVKREVASKGRLVSGSSGDPYTILGINPQLPFDQKKQRYRQLMRIVHSDKGGDDQLAAVINSAWDEVCRREGVK